MRPAFGVPIRGSLVLFFSMTALFVFTTAGMGLAAATVTRNQAQVGMMTLLAVAPMLLLSGLVAPIEALPTRTQHLMMLSPLRYFIEIANGILLNGSDLAVLWQSVGAMALLGSGFSHSACGDSGGSFNKHGSPRSPKATGGRSMLLMKLIHRTLLRRLVRPKPH
jgi:hypothetical protein